MFVALAILALGVLVVVHEAGHYFVAKWSGMRVERFSIGFGPPVLKWKRGETQFQLAPVPFGGFVQIVGMNPHEEFDERDPRVYPNRPAILRFLTILAGPAMNYVFAILVIFVVFIGTGVETGTAWFEVRDVTVGQPAHGVLEPGDRLLKVNGAPVFAGLKDGTPKDFRGEVQKAQASGPAPVTITVLRAGQELDLQLTPRSMVVDIEGREVTPAVIAQVQAVIARGGLDAQIKPSYLVGVQLQSAPERMDVGVGAALVAAAEYPAEKTGQILDGLWQIITGEQPADLGGPVMIVRVMHQEISYGWVRAFEIIAMLNVYLGLFNLLPIPGLDGGRLAFLGYELATRRRPNPKVEATVHMFGFLVLFVVLILVTFKDIRNLFI